MGKDTGEQYRHRYRKIGSYAGVIREFTVEKSVGPGSGIKKIVNIYAHTRRTYPYTKEGIEVSKGRIAGVEPGTEDDEHSWPTMTRWYTPKAKGQKASKRTKKRGRGGKPFVPRFSIPITRLV
jgi:hypothetical protein